MSYWNRMKEAFVSKFSNWMVRTLTRDHLRICTVEHLERKRLVYSPGTLTVQVSVGGERELHFEQMYNLDIEAVQAEDTLLLEMLTEMWPEATETRLLHPFKDGLSLCDITHLLRSEAQGVSLLSYGQLKGWWRVVLDENLTCAHTEYGVCPSYCILYIDRVNQPPRRPKKKREPLRSRLRLPELALPRPGFALG